MLSKAINDEIVKLIAARAQLSAGNHAQAQIEIDKLNLTALPTGIAHALAAGTSRGALLGRPSPPSTANPQKAVDEALDYYASVHKLISGCGPSGEITEDVALGAINKYWKKSYPVQIAVVLIALACGGSVVGLVQVEGVEAKIHEAQSDTSALTEKVAQNRGDIDKKVAAITGDLKVAEANVKNLADTTADKVSNDLSAEVKDHKTQVETKIDGYYTSAADELDKHVGTQTGAIDKAGSVGVTAVQARVNITRSKLAAAIADQAGQKASSLLKKAAATADKLEALYKKELEAQPAGHVQPVNDKRKS